MTSHGNADCGPTTSAESCPLISGHCEQIPRDALGDLRAGFPLGGPAMNVGPVPGGPATDRPAGLREHATVAPDIHRGALDAEPLGDLGDADRVTNCHMESVAKVLTVDQDCSDNLYMTQTHRWERIKSGTNKGRWHCWLCGTVTGNPDKCRKVCR